MSVSEKLDLNQATEVKETVLTFPGVLKPPVMTEAIDGELHYDQIGDPTPLVFHYPGMSNVDPDLRSITVIIAAGNTGIFFDISRDDAHKAIDLRSSVSKARLAVGQPFRVRASLYFNYSDGTEKNVRSGDNHYMVVR